MRFHYMRRLEDRITPNLSDPLLWGSYSSPITTKNIKHVNNKYAKFSYFGYTFSILFLFLFCSVITISQFCFLNNVSKKELSDNLFFALCITPMILYVVIIIATIFIYLYSSIQAKKIDQYAMQKALKNKKDRLGLKQKDE